LFNFCFRKRTVRTDNLPSPVEVAAGFARPIGGVAGPNAGVAEAQAAARHATFQPTNDATAARPVSPVSKEMLDSLLHLLDRKKQDRNAMYEMIGKETSKIKEMKDPIIQSLQESEKQHNFVFESILAGSKTSTGENVSQAPQTSATTTNTNTAGEDNTENNGLGINDEDQHEDGLGINDEDQDDDGDDDFIVIPPNSSNPSANATNVDDSLARDMNHLRINDGTTTAQEEEDNDDDGGHFDPSSPLNPSIRTSTDALAGNMNNLRTTTIQAAENHNEGNVTSVASTTLMSTTAQAYPTAEEEDGEDENAGGQLNDGSLTGNNDSDAYAELYEFYEKMTPLPESWLRFTNKIMPVGDFSSYILEHELEDGDRIFGKISKSFNKVYNQNNDQRINHFGSNTLKGFAAHIWHLFHETFHTKRLSTTELEEITDKISYYFHDIEVELADHFEMFMFYMDRREFLFPGHADFFFVDLCSESDESSGSNESSGTYGTCRTYDESD
jgi:hypothetical protein